MKLAPGEQHDTDLVTPQPGDEVGDFQLGPVQAGGLQVLGQHAAGDVQGDHDLDPALLDDLDVAAPLGPGQGQDQQGDPDEPEGQPEAARPAAGHQAQALEED